MMKTLLAGCFLLWTAACASAEDREVRVRSVIFTPDGQRLVLGLGTHLAGGELVVWNLQTKSAEKRLTLEKSPGVSSLSISSDEKRLAISISGRAPRVFAWPTLELEFEAAKDYRGPVVFSPDGTLLAMNGGDGKVICREMATGKERSYLARSPRGFGIAFSPNGKQLVSTGEKDTIGFDVETGKENYRLKQGSYWTKSACFSADGQWLLTDGGDSSVRLWKAETGEPEVRFDRQGGADRIVYSPAIKSFVVCKGRLISIYRLDFSPPTAAVQKQIDAAIQRLDADAPAVREAAQDELQRIGWSALATLERAAAEAKSAEVRIGARLTRQKILDTPQATLDAHTGEIRGLALSPDGKRLASASDDGTVRVWDLATFQRLENLSP